MTLRIALAAGLIVGAVIESRPQAQTATALRPAAAQSRSEAMGSATDLSGVWTNATITPLERPARYGDKAKLTAQEAARFEREAIARRNADRRDGGAQADLARAYNDAWWDYGTNVVSDLRTSLIIDPPDGRLPALTTAAQETAAARARARQNRGPADSWEDRNLFERCMTKGTPKVPGSYNNNLQIVQSADHVAILQEMIHEVRVIPLDGRPHLPSTVRQWMGDARGHWDGNTLVVETTNFDPRQEFTDTTRALLPRRTRVWFPPQAHVVAGRFLRATGG